MKLKFFLAFSLMLLLFLNSCKKNDEKRNNKGEYTLCIDLGCANEKKTQNCEDAFAIFSYFSSGGKSLNLIGKFPDSSYIELDLLWDGVNMAFTFDGITNGNGAAYNFLFGQLPGYNTFDHGARGNLLVTKYDQTNQRITGTFEFMGKYFNGVNYENNFKKFSGTFSNIPILGPNNPTISSFCN